MSRTFNSGDLEGDLNFLFPMIGILERIWVVTFFGEIIEVKTDHDIHCEVRKFFRKSGIVMAKSVR